MDLQEKIKSIRNGKYWSKYKIVIFSLNVFLKEGKVHFKQRRQHKQRPEDGK